jgi:hypothetical protein
MTDLRSCRRPSYTITSLHMTGEQLYRRHSLSPRLALTIGRKHPRNGLLMWMGAGSQGSRALLNRPSRSRTRSVQMIRTRRQRVLRKLCQPHHTAPHLEWHHP